MKLRELGTPSLAVVLLAAVILTVAAGAYVGRTVADLGLYERFPVLRYVAVLVEVWSAVVLAGLLLTRRHFFPRRA